MKIEWLGLNCIRIHSKKLDQEVSIVIDPFSTKETGLKLPRNLKADIIIDPHSNVGEKEQGFIISTPGEYEIKGVFIYGIPFLKKQNNQNNSKRSIIFRLEREDMVLAHLGDIDSTLDIETLEKLQNIDILMVPVGANETFSAKKAVEVIKQIEPRIVIPINFYVPGLKIKLDRVELFCKEIEKECNEVGNFLKISKKDLPQDEMRVVILNKV